MMQPINQFKAERKSTALVCWKWGIWHISNSDLMVHVWCNSETICRQTWWLCNVLLCVTLKNIWSEFNGAYTIIQIPENSGIY